MEIVRAHQVVLRGEHGHRYRLQNDENLVNAKQMPRLRAQGGVRYRARTPRLNPDVRFISGDPQPAGILPSSTNFRSRSKDRQASHKAAPDVASNREDPQI